MWKLALAFSLFALPAFSQQAPDPAIVNQALAGKLQETSQEAFGWRVRALAAEKQLEDAKKGAAKDADKK